MFIAINNEPCVSGDFHRQRSQVINYVRVTDESSWHVSKYAGSPSRTTWEAFFCQKRLVKNRRGKRRRFPITYKLLMSRRAKRASSCGGFRFYPPDPTPPHPQPPPSTPTLHSFSILLPSLHLRVRRWHFYVYPKSDTVLGFFFMRGWDASRNGCIGSFHVIIRKRLKN